MLTGAGPASRWTPNADRSAKPMAFGSGSWSIGQVGRRQSRFSAAHRVDLRDYIAHLRRRSSPHTVLGRLRNLSSAVAVMDPSADRALIKLAF